MTGNHTGRKTIIRRIRVTVEFHHVDMMNVVHNVQYFKWFEKGRLLILNDVIPVSLGVERGIAVPVVKNYCEYLNGATYGDELVVTTKHRIEPVWPGVFRFEHAISNARSKIEVCSGWSEVTVINVGVGRILKEIPADIWDRYQTLA